MAVLSARPTGRDVADELLWHVETVAALIAGGLRALGWALWQLRRLPRCTWGPIAATLLAAGMGVHAWRMALDDPRPWLGVLAAPVLVVVACVVFYVWVVSGMAPTTIKTGHGSKVVVRQSVTGRTKMTAHYAPSPTKPKTPMMTARHEGGHAAAAHHVGGHAVEAHAYSDGSGWCSAWLPRRSTLRERVVNYVAFVAGGEVAVHSRAGCSHDQNIMSWALRKLPPEEQARARAEGYSLAHSATFWQSAIIDTVASALVRTGKYYGGGGADYRL